MNLINRNEVIKVASISAISLTEKEADILTRELEIVLEYASSLQKISVPAHHSLPKNSNVMRDDEVKWDAHTAETIICMAPEREDSLFVVPVIVK